MQDFLIARAEVEGFINNDQTSKQCKDLLRRLLMEECRRIEKNAKLKVFLYENGQLDFYNAFEEAHELIINSNVSNDAKELLLLPLKKQLFIKQS